MSENSSITKNGNKEINILILDDEQNILNALNRLFLRESFGIFLTTRYEEALAVLDKEPIKVVLSDYRMPNITGVEFLNQVKIKRPSTVRILFTGFADIQVAEDAINKDEVYRFINKPWNDEDLKATIKEAIHRFDLVSENKKLLDTTVKQNEELVAANKRLKEMYELQSEFTSTVSHELRTPLAAIKMAVDIVSKNTDGKINNEQASFLQIAKRNVDRLYRLISDILDLTKLESGKENLKMEKVNINDIVSEITKIQEPVASEKGLNLKTHLDKNMSPIKLNSDKINQVINNLVGNAIKFTKTGSIVISTEKDSTNHHIKVCVKDTGSGIRKEDLSKLFQKFQQLENMEDRVNGTGLGLAICKEIVGKHGGNIWVESEFGKGSSFIFTLSE